MFVLAHLSDPHLAPLPAPRWTELIGKRITGYINWRRRRHLIHDRGVLDRIVADLKSQTTDHIAVTGDIANIALPGEFPRGREWLRNLGSPDDVSFVLGNHDIYVGEAAPLAMRDWSPYMTDDAGDSGFPYLRRRENIVLIGLTTGVPSAPFLATGRLGKRQLDDFSALLESLEREKIFRVVMIHHPPVSKASGHKRLVDADDFLRVIAAHGAGLVIHGHDHLHMINWLAGPNGVRVPAVGVPSASAAPGMSRNAAAYNLYFIDGTPRGWRCEMISRGIGPSGQITEKMRATLVG